MTPADRRKLGAIAALVLGVFLGLCLLPSVPTGAIGRTLGGLLWRGLGAGAVGLPLLGLALALAGFDRLPRLDMKRTALLLGGLALIVPFAAGVITGSQPADFDPPLADWTVAARMAGLIPGVMATAVTGLIGKTGGLLLAFLALSAVTIPTLAWHPLRRLEKSTVPAGPIPEVAKPKRAPKTAVVDDDGPVVESHQPKPALIAAVEPEATKKKSPKPPKPAKEGKPSAAGLPTGDENELPPVELLLSPPNHDLQADEAELDRLGQSLLDTLRTFKVDGSISGRTSGPVVTQFEVVPAPGVKAGRIVALADDLAITMRAMSIRVAPIPGRGAVGVEIPNPTPRMVIAGHVFTPRSPAHLSCPIGYTANSSQPLCSRRRRQEFPGA